MLTVYGNRGSGNSNKVEYAALLAHVPYEYKEMDFRKDIKTEAYLKIHPAGQLPSIDDDGFILFESGAIIKYIAEGTTLYPSDKKKQRALINQWIDFCTLHVGAAFGKVAFNRVFAPMFGMPADEAAIAEGYKQLDRFLPIVEKQLSKQRFLATETITLADVTLLAVFEYADKAKFDLNAYPHITSWRKNLMDMDFYKAVHKS